MNDSAPRLEPSRAPRVIPAGPGLVAAALVMSLVLTGCGGAEPAPGADGPTIQVGGEKVPEAWLTDALHHLCLARDEAPDRPRAAGDRFFDRSHEALHTIARALEDSDRPLAGRLLEDKQRVEAALRGLASGDRVAEDLGRLVAVTAAALARLEVPLPPCAK